MMKTRATYKQAFASIAVAAFLTAAVAMQSGTFNNAYYESQHAANLPEITAAAQASQSASVLVVKHGLETQRCGFHIIDPPVRSEESWLSSSAYPGVNDTNWDWVGAVPAYPEPLPGYAEPIPGWVPSVVVSVRRVFPNGVATLSKVQTATRWDVVATFSDRGLGVVSDVHGPRFSSARFLDWYGELHLHGGEASSMQAALVVDGIALLPFSVTDLVDLSGPQSVTVAEGISEEEADDIIRKFENS